MRQGQVRLHRIGLAIASVLYLGAEILFNVSLLEVVSRADLAPETARKVEEFGRRASSTGFSLFVVGLFAARGFVVRDYSWWMFAIVVAVCTYPFLLTDDHLYTLIFVVTGASLVVTANWIFRIRRAAGSLLSLLGLVVMTWPAFYNGKIVIIEHYLVERSTGLERLVAGHVGLLRRALVMDTVEIHDVVLSELGGADRPEAKAFLVTLGPLSIYADALQDWASEQGNVQRLARTVVANRKIVDIGAKYAEYLQQRKTFIREVYTPYSQASKKYIERAPGIEERAAEAWQDLQVDLDNGWEAYVRASEDFVQFHVDLAQRGISRKLQSFFERRERCGRSTDCLQRLDRRYEQEMRQWGDPPPWTLFCRDTSLLDRVVRTNPDGLSVRINPFALFRMEYRCDTSSENVGLKLAAWRRKAFENNERNPAGLPLGLTRDAWRESPRLVTHVRARLEGELGLPLSSSWSLRDQAGFYSAYRRQADAQAMKKWQAQSSQMFNAVVPNGLSMDGLTRTSAIQDRLRQRLGSDYVEGFLFSWSEEAYAENVVRPLIEHRIRQAVEAFEFGADDYRNGGERAEMGKEMFRSAILPAIAVALSLFFSLLSVGKFFSSLASVLAARVIGGSGWKGIIAAVVVYAMPIWALCQAPFMVTNQYAESETWRILSEEAQRKAPVLTVMSEYVLRMEPLLATAGRPLMAVVDPFELGRTPEMMIEEQAQPSLTTEEVQELQLMLEVNSDGIVGPRTRAAVADKQDELGLKRTGIPTRQLLELLRTGDSTQAPSTVGGRR